MPDQLARGLFANFAPDERPFATPNGMEDNLRFLDDHIGLYTLLAPVAPGTPLPIAPAEGDGQLFTDGSYSVYNASSWKNYPARPGIQVRMKDGSDVYLSTAVGSWLSMRQAAALDAATVARNIYATTAAGVAAVADGAFFTVPSVDPHEFVDLYQRVGGGAVLIKSYPSYVALADSVSAASGSASAAHDSEQNAAASRVAIDDRIYPGVYDPADLPTSRPISGNPSADGDVLFGTDGFTYVRKSGAWVNQTAAAAASALNAFGSAESSSNSASLASASEAAAQTAKTGAETARDAALAAQRIYATAAAGDAATTAGQYFYVVSATSTNTLELWLHNGTGGSDTGKRMPASARVDALEALINGTTPSGELLVVTDKDGYEVVTFYQDGGYRTLAVWVKPYTGFQVRDADGWVVFDSADFGSSPARLSALEVKQSKAYALRALLFGDSITQTGNTAVGDFGRGYRANWPDYAYTMLQMADLKNYATSGASFREYVGQSDWQKISYQVSTSISNGETPDYIVLSCGTNDGTANLGDYATAMGKATLGDLDLSKTIEAMRWAFWKIRTSYPNAKCFQVLPIQRADAETTDRQALLDAITQMAHRYNFIVIDAHNESDIVKDFEVWGGSGRDLSDGLHPAATGQQKMARLISAKVKNAFNY